MQTLAICLQSQYCAQNKKMKALMLHKHGNNPTHTLLYNVHTIDWPFSPYVVPSLNT